MTDLILIRRRDRILIVHDSEKGKRWLINNMITAHPHSVNIALDLLEDFIRVIELEGLTYDDR